MNLSVISPDITLPEIIEVIKPAVKPIRHKILYSTDSNLANLVVSLERDNLSPENLLKLVRSVIHELTGYLKKTPTGQGIAYMFEGEEMIAEQIRETLNNQRENIQELCQ